MTEPQLPLPRYVERTPASRNPRAGAVGEGVALSEDEAEIWQAVEAIEQSMAARALEAWSAANARTGLADHEALLVHADALTRWSERLRMALRGDLVGDEDWLRADLRRVLDDNAQGGES